MSKLTSIAEKCHDANFKRIYEIIDARIGGMQYTADGVPTMPLSHTSDEVREIKSLMFDSVKAAHLASASRYQTFEELQQEVKIDTQNLISRVQKDGFYNPLSGFGTNSDVGMYNSASVPIVFSPEECTALYANGGIAQIIIDKKSKGVQLNGYTITSALFDAQALKDLQEYADSIGFSTAISDAARDGNIYGGAVLFPMLNLDNPISVAMTAPQLVMRNMLRKNCIVNFVTADRWNLVVIPNYDLCAQDYMKPTSFYVPISGLEVHSDRAAIIRPRPQPYWAAIRQLGWGMPDFVGYMRSLLGYEIMAMSLPIMCQQMSLLVHQLPLDGIIAQNGPEAAKKWQRENEEQLRNWSMLNPKAINSYGTIAVVNRQYTGFNNIIDAMRKDVSAKAGIPESVIFFSQPNGIFNKNEEDVLLKQSETIRLAQKTIAPAVSKILPYIASSLWGCPDWDTFRRYQTLQISFDTPVVSSPTQKADIGLKYAQTISNLVAAGMLVEQAVSFATKIIGEVQLPSDFESITATLPQAQFAPVDSEDSVNNPQSQFPQEAISVA